MSSFNRATILGRLGADPETRSVADTTVANLSVATDSSWTDKQGVKQKKTQWHRVKVWGRQAELCRDYLHKGSQVLVEGSLETHSYDDPQGVRRFVTEIKARDVRFVGGRQDAPSSTQAGQATAQAAPDPAYVPDSEVPF